MFCLLVAVALYFETDTRIPDVMNMRDMVLMLLLLSRVVCAIAHNLWNNPVPRFNSQVAEKKTIHNPRNVLLNPSHTPGMASRIVMTAYIDIPVAVTIAALFAKHLCLEA